EREGVAGGRGDAGVVRAAVEMNARIGGGELGGEARDVRRGRGVVDEAEAPAVVGLVQYGFDTAAQHPLGRFVEGHEDGQARAGGGVEGKTFEFVADEAGFGFAEPELI